MPVSVYHYQDRDSSRQLAPGTVYWMKMPDGVTNRNIAGGVGTYSFTLHIAGNGDSGDAISYTIVRRTSSGAQSVHYIQSALVIKSILSDNVEFKTGVNSGDQIWVRVSASAVNSTNVVIDTIDTDSYLFS